MLGLEGLPHGRVVVVGIGNTLRSDDGAGPALAARLSRAYPDIVFNAGQAPENYIAPIRRAAPSAIILVDAADFGAAPGEVRTAGADDVEGLMMGTHAAPLSMLMRVLNDETGADVRLVAIQAGSTEVGEGLGDDVARAVDRIVDELDALLREGTEP